MSEIREAHELISFPRMEHIGGSIGFLEKMFLGQLLFLVKPNVVIETGVFKGMTTRFVREFLDLNNMSGSRVYGFDFEQVVDERLTEPFFNESPGVELVPGILPQSLELFLGKKSIEVDFAIVDGNHAYEGVLLDLKALEPYISVDGVIFCHDYRTGDDVYEGTCRAINEFCDTCAFQMFHIQSEKASVWGSAFLQRVNKKGVL